MKTRLISALIALIIFIPIFILGGIYFKVGISILAVLALREILKLKENIPSSIKLISYIIIFILLILNVNSVIGLFISILIYFTLLIFMDKEKYNINDLEYITCFTCFFTLVFNYIIVIRNNDINILIYLLMITILTDSFAYFGGKLFGKHKLIEKISPNKTIEGSISGTIVGTIFPAAFYIYFINPGEYLFLSFLITFALSIIGQIGDLIFSSIKRYYKIKDFSNIMPGHGGILDRLDSIIFVIIGYIILNNFL